MCESKKRILWGFPGCGKSSIANGTTILDVDCMNFQFQNINRKNLHGTDSWDVEQDSGYPENYVLYVREADAAIVLINCHLELLQRFPTAELVYPAKELKEEYLERYRQRGDSDSFVRYMSENFEPMIEMIERMPNRKKYPLKEKGMYLCDVLEKEKGSLEKQMAHAKEKKKNSIGKKEKRESKELSMYSDM